VPGLICTSELERHWNKERADISPKNGSTWLVKRMITHLKDMLRDGRVETVRNSGAVRTEFVLCAGNTRNSLRKRVDL
jgi:hypothetical protein